MIYALLFALICLASCNNQQSSNVLSEPNQKDFNMTLDGQNIQIFRLTNANGLSADITNYGGKVVRLLVPDRNGKFEDIVQGFDNIDG